MLKSESKQLHAQIKSLTISASAAPNKSAQEVAVSALYADEISRVEEENNQLRQALSLANAQLRTQAAVTKTLTDAGFTQDSEKNQLAIVMDHMHNAEKRYVRNYHATIIKSI
jgi:hypothetical protein